MNGLASIIQNWSASYRAVRYSSKYSILLLLKGHCMHVVVHCSAFSPAEGVWTQNRVRGGVPNKGSGQSFSGWVMGLRTSSVGKWTFQDDIWYFIRLRLSVFPVGILAFMAILNFTFQKWKGQVSSGFEFPKELSTTHAFL